MTAVKQNCAEQSVITLSFCKTLLYENFRRPSNTDNRSIVFIWRSLFYILRNSYTRVFLIDEVRI